LILFVDNYDSFSYNLVDYLEQKCVEVEVVRNDIESQIEWQKYDGVVLSPGPKTPSESGKLMNYLDQCHEILPILGICLGHQAIGEKFGATLSRAAKPMHGKVTSVAYLDDPIFSNVSNPFEAVQYNSLVLEDCENLKVIATSTTGEIMAIRHHSLPIWGLQFHPEAILSKFGLKILSNWLEYNNIV